MTAKMTLAERLREHARYHALGNPNELLIAAADALDRCEKALEPFEWAFKRCGGGSDTSTDHWQLNQSTGLKYSDLRAAATAHAKLKEGE